MSRADEMQANDREVQDDGRVTWNSLNEKDKRLELCNYLRKWTCQRGLIGEAVNEHRNAIQIESAVFSGDVKSLGELVYQAILEYMGKVISDDPEWKIQP